MSKEKFSCDSCDAYGSVNHSMDSEYFEVSVCPFCGSPLMPNKDDDDELDD